jgi:hypothetical protein
LIDHVEKSDPNASIPHHDKMTFEGIKGADGKLVEVRRHSTNPKYPAKGPTTQVNTVKTDPATGRPKLGPDGRTYSDKFMDSSGKFIKPKTDAQWDSVHHE